MMLFRRFPVWALAFAFAPLAAAPVSLPLRPPASPEPLPTTVVDWGALAAKRTAAGLTRPVFDNPAPPLTRLELHVTTLAPGKFSHAPHHHPWEEMLLVKEGRLAVAINGRTQPAEAGALVFFASHDVHNVRNVGPGPATYYVINFYTPAVAGVRDQPAAQWEPAGDLHSGVIHWDALPSRPAGAGLRRTYVDSPTLTFPRLEVHATTLPAHAPPTAPHRHPWSVLTVVRDGILELSLDGTCHRMGPGSFAFLKPDTLQSLRNAGPEPVTYLVFSVSSQAGL